MFYSCSFTLCFQDVQVTAHPHRPMAPDLEFPNRLSAILQCRDNLLGENSVWYTYRRRSIQFMRDIICLNLTEDQFPEADHLMDLILNEDDVNRREEYLSMLLAIITQVLSSNHNSVATPNGNSDATATDTTQNRDGDRTEEITIETESHSEISINSQSDEDNESLEFSQGMRLD